MQELKLDHTDHSDLYRFSTFIKDLKYANAAEPKLWTS